MWNTEGESKAEDMKQLKLFACRWKEHCGEHRVNEQRRRADANETFPITSYKVDMKICHKHTLCCCHAGEETGAKRLSRQKLTTNRSVTIFFVKGPLSLRSDRKEV